VLLSEEVVAGVFLQFEDGRSAVVDEVPLCAPRVVRGFDLVLPADRVEGIVLDKKAIAIDVRRIRL